MSEYMEKHNVSRLIGSPPGYVGYEEGGQLTERIRRKPYSVVLLDEIEKAHPDFANMLLQILEEGRLTDSFGRVVDFRNTILIMTSNLGVGAVVESSPLGFRPSESSADRDARLQEIREELQSHFRPEFLNRLDAVVMFEFLDEGALHGIVDLELRKIRDRLERRKILLEVDEEAHHYFVRFGYSDRSGARGIRHILEERVEDALSEMIILGQVHPGDIARVHVEGDRLEIQVASESCTSSSKASEATDG
jgi:ATP-dependent Clp protease ATP-binding subunit ClpC